MSPSKQSDSLQATNQPRPPVPFQLTLYPPSLRPNQYYTPKEEEVLIEISTDEELDQDEKYPEEATRNIEQLIEESSDKGLFHAKLKRLEKESLRRFENKWTGIISKYLNINDERESDEIDLVTGDIITNNGHLHRLRSGDDDGKRRRRLTTFKLWKQHEDTRHDNATVRNRLRKQLDEKAAIKKERERNMRRMRIPSPLKSSSNSVLTSADSLRHVSPTKGQVPIGVDTDESPTKKRKIFIQQDSEISNSEYSETETNMSSDYSVDNGSEADNTVEEDELYEESSDGSEGDNEEESSDNEERQEAVLLLLLLLRKGNYFSQFSSSILNAPRLGLDEGPLSRSTPEPDLPSENKRASLPMKKRSGIEFGLIPMKHKPQPSKVKSKRFQQSRNDSSDNDNSIHNLSHLFLEHSLPKPNKVHNQDQRERDEIEPSPFLDQSLPLNSPAKNDDKHLDKNVLSLLKLQTLPPLTNRASCESFEEQISIVEEPYYFMGNILPSPASLLTLKIFNCCVTGCSFCTMNRKMYASHLIKHHSDILYQLGYPVELDTRRDSMATAEDVERQVTPSEKRTLLNEFPLRFEIPVSATSVYKCGKLVNKGDTSPCQMFFLHFEDLIKHQQRGECNCQTQIIFCPILGCGYMTDGGYEEWRNHLIDAGHCQIEHTRDDKRRSELNDVDAAKGHNGSSAADADDRDDDSDIEIVEVRTLTAFLDDASSNNSTRDSTSIASQNHNPPSSNPKNYTII